MRGGATLMQIKDGETEAAQTLRSTGACRRGQGERMKLRFLGGAGTVTGSRFLLENEGRRILVDCGLFQGLKNLRLRNWAPFPVEPALIDAVVLTHAHLDHSGALPLLVRDGFRFQIHCTPPTADLCEILLRDAGRLQERDADFANRHGFSKHKPALPLYTEADAERALSRLVPLPFHEDRRLAGDTAVTFARAGHILGAASVALTWNGTRIVFSGDLGRYDDAMMVDPEPVAATDTLIVESTYGGRRHERISAEDALADVIARTIGRGGTIVIPSFAVGRAQSLLLHLYRLKEAGRLPHVPIFLDSPMAMDAGDLLCKYPQDLKLPERTCRAACHVARYVQNAEESKALTANPMPKIILSASGMATGGRVLHHLVHYAPDPRNTVLFAGFQAAGTRGAAMVAGAEAVKIHGAYVPIRAEVANLSMMSAHADADDILRWLRNFQAPPRRTFIVHGEPGASDALRCRIADELGWDCTVPELGEQVVLA